MSWKFNRLFALALLSNKMADLVSCRSSFIRAAEEIAKVQLGRTSSRLPLPPPHLYPFGKQGQPVLTFKYMYFICPLGGKFSRRPSVNVRFDSSDKPVRASSNAVPLYWGLAYRIKGHQSTVAVPGWSSFLVCIRIGQLQRSVWPSFSWIANDDNDATVMYIPWLECNCHDRQFFTYLEDRSVLKTRQRWNGGIDRSMGIHYQTPTNVNSPILATSLGHISVAFFAIDRQIHWEMSKFLYRRARWASITLQMMDDINPFRKRTGSLTEGIAIVSWLIKYLFSSCVNYRSSTPILTFPFDS